MDRSAPQPAAGAARGLPRQWGPLMARTTCAGVI
jgi:hypothetical protein